jgi:hypothetical protein
VRKGQLEAAAKRAAVPVVVVDALKEAWPSISVVEVEVFRNRPHVSCRAHTSNVGEELTSVMRAAGAEVNSGTGSKIISGWWPAPGLSADGVEGVEMSQQIRPPLPPPPDTRRL